MRDVSRRSVLARASATLLSGLFGRAAMARDPVSPSPPSSPFPGGPVLPEERRAAIRLLRAARYWGCQYQNIDVDRLSASALDFIVVDHALGVPESIIASPEDVARLKRKPDGGRRIVLGYLSVGEAESYRPYWRAEWKERPPAWLAAPNPDWPGAHGVRFWDPAWQDIVYSGRHSILNCIVDAGFDGVFLDRVDAYADWLRTRARAVDDMIALVGGLAVHARDAAPGFLVVGQNAEGLLRDARYRGHIDGAAKESLLFGLRGAGVRNTDADIAWSLAGLNAVKRDGLPVFAIEYIDDPAQIARARDELDAMGFQPFFARRALDELPVSYVR